MNENETRFYTKSRVSLRNVYISFIERSESQKLKLLIVLVLCFIDVHRSELRCFRDCVLHKKCKILLLDPLDIHVTNERGIVTRWWIAFGSEDRQDSLHP